MTHQDIEQLVSSIAQRAQRASSVLRSTSTRQKNEALLKAAAMLRGPARDKIVAANQKDLDNGKKNQLSTALMDRLKLDSSKLEGVAKSIEQIVSLPDPVGQIEKMNVLDNGLSVGRMRIPIGVIGIIYESRPNVTADAAALCIKSGNAVVLRGGSEAFHSNQALAEVFSEALSETGLPQDAAILIPTTDRAATTALLHQDAYVNLMIPRGGEGLIRFVTDNAKMPVIQHYKGVCHVYVDGEANLDMAHDIVVNSKTQRPGVCNALETLLVDRACANEFLPKVAKTLLELGVELRGDEETCKHISQAKPATEEDWDTEYLDLILAIRVVDGIDGAIAHIEQHGSLHTESIVTENYTKAQKWTQSIDASLVLVNASTRFNDGGQLGLGAEMGISTSKLHAYGPMGLSELCTQKWVGLGQGQIRN